MSAAVVESVPPSTVTDALQHAQINGKRKRSTEVESHTASDDIPDVAGSRNLKEEKLNRALDHLFVILKSYDTEPSVLEFSLPADDNNEPFKKRARLGSNGSKQSISDRISSHHYESIDEVAADIRKVVASLAISIDSRTIESVQNFEEKFKDIVAQEILRNSSDDFHASSNLNNVKEENVKDTHLGTSVQHGSQTVLALHGGTPGGRPLFSSLRHPSSLNTLGHPASISSTERSVRDLSLPNGISTIAIVPVLHTDKSSQAKEVPLLGELCPVPPHFSPADPPKPLPHSTTRGSVVGWYKPSMIPPPLKRPGVRDTSYTYQNLAGGDWLSYNVPPAAPIQSTGEKRKQRDRTLSTGEHNPERSAEDIERERLQMEAHQQIRDTEHFKSVYSSFAPSYDDSSAVVPQQLKSKLWWHKIGRMKYQDQYLPEEAAAFSNETDDPLSADRPAPEDEERVFKEAVDFLSENPIDPALEGAELSVFGKTEADGASNRQTNDKDVDEILREISDLLQTLDSHQRIRHMSLATTAQTSASQNKALAELSGSPSSPTEAEYSIYSMLKDQLAIMIATLPPFAVAKLNGEQLDALNISTNIRVKEANRKGLIHDESAKQASTTMNGVGNPALRPQSISGVRSSPYQPQAVTPSHRGGYSAARPNASTYYPPSRVAQGSASYSTYTPPNVAQNRPTYQQYSGQHTPQHPQYGNAPRPMIPNGYGPHGMAGTLPMAARANQVPPRQNPAAFPARPPSTPGYVTGYPVAGGKHGSPQGRVSNYPTQRPPQTPINQQPPPIQHASPPRAQGFTTPTTNGKTYAQAINRTPEEQSRMIQEQSIRLQRGQLNRANSNTPQPLNGSPSRTMTNGNPPNVPAAPAPAQSNGNGGA